MQSLTQFIFPIIITLVVVFALIRNYRKDPGEHKKAKIVHGIIITILGIGYANSLGTFLRTIGSMTDVLTDTNALGILPAGAHKLFLILNAITGLFVIWLLDSLIKREQRGKKILIMILPLMGILSTLNFYGALVDLIALISQETDSPVAAHVIILIICLAIAMGFHLAIWFIYRTKFIARFFNFDHESSLPEKSQLDAWVDGIGEEE